LGCHIFFGGGGDPNFLIQFYKLGSPPNTYPNVVTIDRAMTDAAAAIIRCHY